MVTKYWYRTKIGVFTIELQRSADGERRWHPTFDGDSLGAYTTPQAALDDLAGGHTWSIRGGADTSKLGLPEEIDGWATD